MKRARRRKTYCRYWATYTYGIILDKTGLCLYILVLERLRNHYSVLYVGVSPDLAWIASSITAAVMDAWCTFIQMKIHILFRRRVLTIWSCFRLTSF